MLRFFVVASILSTMAWPSFARAGCDGIETLVGNNAQCLKWKDKFKDCIECPEMVVLPAGSFSMGSTESEIATFQKGHGFAPRSESPRHQVTIARPFAVGKFEVTFAEWDACVAAGGCKHRPGDEGWGRGKRPVINVLWDNVTGEYLPWLSRKTGRAYRLLAEAEWEYAARAGSTTQFHFGDEEKDLCTYANVFDQSTKGVYGRGTRAECSDGYVFTAPVGSFKPNAFGLHDLHGNVREWVEDCWNGNYKDAPSDGSAWTTGDCGRRVVRGGSWVTFLPGVRSARRIWNLPGYRPIDLGFRVARTL